MRFEEYNYEHNESSLVKSIYRLKELIQKKLSSSTVEINLVDPQTRLEESITELSAKNDKEFKLIKETFYSQMNDINEKMSNTKQRLEDCLVEMSRKTVANFETSADDSSAALLGVESNLLHSQDQIKNNIFALDVLTNTKFYSTKQSLIQTIKNSDHKNVMHHDSIVSKLNKMLEMDLTQISSNTTSIYEYLNTEFNRVKQVLTVMDGKMNVFQKHIEKMFEVNLIN